MRVITWLESILDANRIRPSRAQRRSWQKRELASYDKLEDRQLLAADTLVSLAGGTLTISDISSVSNDNLTISHSGNAYTISDSSLVMDSNIPGATGQGTSTLSIPDSGVDNITFDTSAGDDTITVVSVEVDMGDFTVLGGAGDDSVNVNGDIYFASNANLSLDLSNGATAGDFDQISLGTDANLKLSGTGAATLVTSGGIGLQSGSSITTVDGNLTLSANQQTTPTAGSFIGVELEGASVEAVGSGVVTVAGRGGDSGLTQHGVFVHQGAEIIGGTTGQVAVTGTGGPSIYPSWGVTVWDYVSTITSNGSDISVIGTGSGNSNAYGVAVVVGAQIVATGSASVMVHATSGVTPQSSSYGYGAFIATNSRVGTVDGELSLTGISIGQSQRSVGIHIDGAAEVSSTGSGAVTLNGTGSANGSFAENYGVWLDAGTVSSNTGSIEIQATAGAGSAALKMENSASNVSSTNAPIVVIADSMAIDSSADISVGSGQSASLRPKTPLTLVDLGSTTDTATNTLELSDAELDAITAGTIHIGSFLGHAITVSAAITSSNDLSLTTSTGITLNNSITMSPDRSFTASAAGSALGIVLATASADISATGIGTVSLTTARNISLVSGSSVSTVDGDLTLSANQQATPTVGNFVGIYVDGGLIESSGSGVVNVAGRGAESFGGAQRGVYVRRGGSIIGGTNGTVTVTGTGGISYQGDNVGVTVWGVGSMISSNGADISVIGLGGGFGESDANFGVQVVSSAQIFAMGDAAVTVHGEGFSATPTGASGYNTGVVVTDVGGIGTMDGNLSVTGIGTGTGNSGVGILMFGGAEIYSTGSGGVTIAGTGSSTGTGNENYGIWNRPNSIISSNTGAIDITATPGAGSVAFKMDGSSNLITMDASITVVADSISIAPSATMTAGSGQTATIHQLSSGLAIDVGSTTDVEPNTLEISEQELNRINAGFVQLGNLESGVITVSAPITYGNNLSLTSAGEIRIASSVTLTVNQSFSAMSVSTAKGILLDDYTDITTSGTGSLSLVSMRNIRTDNFSRITTADGNLNLIANQQATPTSGDFNGIEIHGLIESTGAGDVNVWGRGGIDSAGSQRGVVVGTFGDIIGGISGVLSVTGIGGESLRWNNFGVHVVGGSTITSSGAPISVTGTGGGDGSSSSWRNDGVYVENSQIFAIGATAIEVHGVGTHSSSSNSQTRGVAVYGTNSRIGTENGNLIVSGNASPVLSRTYGVHISNFAEISVSGVGTLTVDGTGSDGVSVTQGGRIVGGTSGLLSVTGNSVDSDSFSFGVHLTSTITSDGAEILVTGTAQGSNSPENHGVLLIGQGQIFTTGSAPVTVHGTSASSDSTEEKVRGVAIYGANSRIGTEDGSLTISGVSTVDDQLSQSAGIHLKDSGVISATGTGIVTLNGIVNASGTAAENFGLWIEEGTISSNTGAIKITATAGAGSDAFKMDSGAPNLTTTDAPVDLIADSVSIDPTAIINAGSGQAVMLRQQTIGLAIDLGGADVFGNTLGLTDAELDRITAGLVQIGDSNSGEVIVSAPLTQGNDLSLTTGGRITVNEPITMNLDRSFSASTTGAARIFLATATADIATIGIGSIALTTPMDIRLASGSSLTTVDGDLLLSANQQTTPTAGSFIGINVINSLVEVSGTGVLTMEGKGGSFTNSQYGIYVNAGGDIVGGTNGLMTVAGTGGASSGSGNTGVLVMGLGSTITSNGAMVSVTGIGDGTGVNAYGVAVFSGGQIFSTGSVPVEIHGTSAATTATTNFGLGVIISGANSEVRTFNGSLSVTGIGLGSTPRAAGIYVFDDAEISSTGSGAINLNGSGSPAGTDAENYGVWLHSGGTVSGATGAIEITAIAGSEAIAFKMDSGTPSLKTINAPIEVIADSMEIDSSAVFKTGASQTVTLRQQTNGIKIDLGGADQLGSALGLTATELNRIESDMINIGDANAGDITFSASVFSGATTGLNLNTGTGLNPAAFGTELSIGTATVEFSFGADLNIAIYGPTVDTQYDQLNVAGQIDLTGLDLVLTGSHAPTIGEKFVVVNNDGVDPIAGTFNGLHEGTTIFDFLGSGLDATISYLGPDGNTGNDAVLTVVVPNRNITQIAPPTSVEGDSGTTNATFQIKLSAPAITTVTVDYVTTNFGFANQATPGVDYVHTTGTATFLAGEDTFLVDVPVHGDKFLESAEQFGLELSNNSVNSNIVDVIGDTTIVNDDVFGNGVIVDFGTPTSPVLGIGVGFGTEDYSAAIGMGWSNTVDLTSAEKTVGNDLARDIAQMRSGTFSVDVPNDTYDVQIYYGVVRRRDPFRITFESDPQITEFLTFGTNVSRIYTTTVSDGQLNMAFTGAPGLDPFARIAGFKINPVAAKAGDLGGKGIKGDLYVPQMKMANTDPVKESGIKVGAELIKGLELAGSVVSTESNLDSFFEGSGVADDSKPDTFVEALEFSGLSSSIVRT